MSPDQPGIIARWRRAVGRRGAKWLVRRPLVLPHTRPVISFTFDDFPRSALFTAGAMLEQNGLAGTYYASMGLAGKVAPTGQIFHPDDLKLLLARGHELGCHTFEHCPAWETGSARYAASIQRNAEALRDVAPGIRFHTHSYPINFPRALTKRRIQRYFRGCRAGGQTFNRGTIDLNYISAFFLEKIGNDLGPIRQIIAANARARGWLVFATHDVAETHTPYGCRPEFFRAVVEESIASGAAVLTVAKALSDFGADLNSS